MAASSTSTLTAAFVPDVIHTVPFLQRRATARIPTHPHTLSSQNSVDAVPNDEQPSSSPPLTTTLPLLFPSLATPLQSLGLSTPTPIQLASATSLSSPTDPHNLLLIAPTGSGKTLAYLLPALSRASTTGGKILIVAPTRELAVQLLRDATDLLASQDHPQPTTPIVLVVRGVGQPDTAQLHSATLLIGTPRELEQTLTTVRGGTDFLAGDTLSTIILDEVDVLLPLPPKALRTSLDKRKGEDKRGGDAVRDERRRKEAKRKLTAAKRKGTETDASQRIIAPTETLLRLAASRRFVGEGAGVVQVIAGSATASRRTLDHLNRVMRAAAVEGASSTYDVVWGRDIKACRPAVDDSDGGEEGEAAHTIRAVTVPREVSHRYITVEKGAGSSPDVVLAAVANAAKRMKPETALVFLCGDFGRADAKGKKRPDAVVKGATSKARRNKGLKQRKLAKKAAEVKKAAPGETLSARKVCSTLAQYNITAQPLHVALGLEPNTLDSNDDDDDSTPPVLVTFEGSARGLHFPNVDAVFVVGRPSSAASYLHLAGRVGRAGVGEDGRVEIRPGTVVSFCTEGSKKELGKWTEQIGGTGLEELVL